MASARLVLAIMALAVSVSAKTRPPESVRPDVILITVDTLRADHVGCFGSKTAATPVLDALCAEGTRFPSAISASPITNTSHASILTGLYPSHHGVSDFGVPLAASHVTVAELLHKQGYHTAAFVGAVILDSKTLAPGFDRGFDYYDNFPVHASSTERWERVERRAEVVVQHAQKWLLSNHAGPRFLWVHLYDPHDPYDPPFPYAKRFKDSLYDGEIAYADHAIGSLFAALKAQLRYNSSLIIVMSDHGEGLGEHNEDTHGIFLYDSTLHIPLIVKLPGAARIGASREAQVRSVDVLPTILEVVGITSDSKFDGKSLLSLSPKDVDRPAISETDYPLRFGWAPLKSVRNNHKKYIDAPRPEFYSLDEDKQELRNVYEPWSPKVQQLRELLSAYRTGTLIRETQGTAQVPASTVAELKALGYLGTVAGSTTASEPSLLPDPKDKIAVQNYIHGGMMQEESGNIAGALKQYAHAVELDPGSGMTVSQLGQAELKAGNYGDAVRHLSTAHALLPSDSSIALKLGEALYRKGDISQAAEILEKAFALVPGQYDARVMLGEIYLAQNKPQQAQDQLEAAILLDSKNSRARLVLAKLHVSRKEVSAAKEQLRELLRADPNNAEAIKLLSSLAQ